MQNIFSFISDKKNKALVLFFVIILFSSCDTNKKVSATRLESTYKIAFYNVENLFDTEDDPTNKGDDEYLPTGKLQWTEERYSKKLTNISQVIAEINPAFIGLAEIENKRVLDDLVLSPSIKDKNYGVIHHNSNDYRGIDCAFLYKKGVFIPEANASVKVVIPTEYRAKDEDGSTRDILYIKGKLNGKSIHIYVTHWPSRRGGEAESEAKRIFVAKELKKLVEVNMMKEKDANVIVMGDLNDEPANKSVTEGLGAKLKVEGLKEKDLYDMMSDLYQEGKGSYYHENDFNVLDHLIVSEALVNAKNGLSATSANIFNAEFLIFQNKKGDKVPNRTYGGTKYYGGYSDHFSVYMTINLK